MDGSVIGMLVRLVVSLGLVLGLMGGIAWVLKRRGPLSGAKGALPVLARQTLGRTASVQVVRIGSTDRALVLGVTDDHVTMLTEVHVDDVTTLDLRDTAAAADDDAVTSALGTTPGGRTGSSGARPSGKSVIDALRDVTVRR
jgi:flagellar biosynthetic protein FliO